jgi:hypothetical protein
MCRYLSLIDHNFHCMLHTYVYQKYVPNSKIINPNCPIQFRLFLIYMCIYIYIYILSTEIPLTHGGNTHLHENYTYNNTSHDRTTQITNNLKECSLCKFYPGICLRSEGKARKNLSQGSRREKR